MPSAEVLLIVERCRLILDLDAAPPFQEYGYENLPLCVIDAVFSINARYAAVENVVARYRVHFGTPKPFDKGIWPPVPEQQETVTDFLTKAEPLGIETLTSVVFGNRQRTSTRSGILKAEAVLWFCRTFQRYRVETIQDMLAAGNNVDLRAAIGYIPGHSSGVSWNYLLMMCGDQDRIKLDRMVLRFLADALGREVLQADAEQLLWSAARTLRDSHPRLTPRRLDSLIWQYQARGDGRNTAVRRQDTCPSCGAATVAAAHFCHRCGQRL